MCFYYPPGYLPGYHLRNGKGHLQNKTGRRVDGVGIEAPASPFRAAAGLRRFSTNFAGGASGCGREAGVAWRCDVGKAAASGFNQRQGRSEPQEERVQTTRKTSPGNEQSERNPTSGRSLKARACRSRVSFWASARAHNSDEARKRRRCCKIRAFRRPRRSLICGARRRNAWRVRRRD